jgi:Sulfotransferase family
MVRAVERASFLPRVWLGRVSGKVREAYRASQEQVFGHALARSGAAIVVDSSKSARLTVGRSFALKRLAGNDVYFLHLVRDGWATLGSRVVTGSNWALEGYAREPRLPTLRAVVGWVWSNCCASMMRRAFGSERYLLLRYEDFLSDPAASLRKIGELVGVDTSVLIERVERGVAFDVGHVVGGNRVRFQKAITLRRQEETSKEQRLTRRQRLLFSILGGWLNRRYGYSA